MAKRTTGKRYDKKGRVLNTNEYQAKDGRYIYHYEDIDGKRCKAYSWCLMSTDKPPKGKKCDKCLREIEDDISKNIHNHVKSAKSKIKTLDELFPERLKYSKIKKESTVLNYTYQYDKYIKPVLGSKKVSDITHSMIRNFYESNLYGDLKLSVDTVNKINTILSPIFEIAVDDDMIIKNPCTKAWKDFANKHSNEINKNTSPRHALSEAEQSAFMNYVKANKQKYEAWYNLLVVFLGTGCRVGELLGLTWADIDFKDGIITINHQLQYRAYNGGKFEKKITPPKTERGKREIAMYAAVKSALLNEKQRQMRDGIFCKDTISGYIENENGKQINVTLSDFVFLNRFGNVQLPQNTNKAFERIRNDYNAFELELAKKERREPVEMPHFSNHVLRHTFCTRHCEQEGIDLTVLADSFGDDISTMMNVYNEVQREHKKRTIANLEGKVLIG